MTNPIVIGDIRDELSREHDRTLDEIINWKQHKRLPYYVLFYADIGLDVYPADAGIVETNNKVMEIDGKTPIRSRVIIFDAESYLQEFLDGIMKGEIRIMGMMCYKIDNVKGEKERLWILPQDIPEIDQVTDSEGIVKEVFDNARRIGKLIH